MIPRSVPKGRIWRNGAHGAGDTDPRRLMYKRPPRIAANDTRPLTEEELRREHQFVPLPTTCAPGDLPPQDRRLGALDDCYQHQVSRCWSTTTAWTSC